MGVDISFTENFKGALTKLDSTGRERMTAAVNEMRGEILVTLSGSRSGRTYKVPGTGRTYTASAPGQPPAQRLGELRQSVSTEVEGTGSKVVGRVGTNKKYGPMLEFGTRNMAPRPWLRPTFEKKQKDVEAIFIRQWF